MIEDKDYYIHPLRILITLVLAGITALFLGISGAYLYTKVQTGAPSIALPSLFYINTIFLLGSGGTLFLAKRNYLNDNTAGYQKSLLATVILTFLFLIAQIFAWQSLFAININVAGDNMGSYLYVISALHFIHVIAGIPFLMLFLWAAYKKMKEPVSVLVYFSDPHKKRKLELLTTYWHYLDGLWIYLLVFFGVCQMFD